MSQAGMTGQFDTTGPRSSKKIAGNKVAPVALLALAVALGVALLHTIDKSPTATERSLENTRVAAEKATAPAAVTPTTVAFHTPAQIKVLITNGTTVSGVAAKFNEALKPRGYMLGTPGNTTAPTTESSIQFAPDYEQDARALAKSLNLPEDLVKPMTNPAPVADTQSANIIVVIGEQLSKNPPTAQTATGTQTQSSVIGPLQSNSSANANSVTTVPSGSTSANVNNVAPGTATQTQGQTHTQTQASTPAATTIR